MTTPAGTEYSATLKKNGSVALDEFGNGTIYFDPENARQRWQVTSVVVATSQAPTDIPVPTAGVYLNGVYQGTALQGVATSPGGSQGVTWSGSQDTFTGQVDVGPCDQLAVVFQSGIAGSTAYANLAGTKYTRRA